jgi:hypothetical protein
MDPMWIVAPLVLLTPVLQSRRPVPHVASASAAGCSARRGVRPPISGAERGAMPLFVGPLSVCCACRRYLLRRR